MQFLITHTRVRSLTLASLLFLNLALRFWVAMRPLEYIDGLTIPDDAYLSLTVARNIAQGEGPSYAGEHTNGFQPFFVFLMVPVFLFAKGDPSLSVHVAAAFSSVFDTLTLFFLCRIVVRRCNSFLSVVPVALGWSLNPIGIRTATNGMETSMACLFLAWGLSYLDRHVVADGPTPPPRINFALGIIIGLAMFARIDNVLFVFSAIATVIFRRRKDLETGLRDALIIAAGAFLMYLPWLACSFAYTGDLYPVSGRAIRLMSLSTVDFNPTFQNWYSVILNAGLDAVIKTNRCTLVLIAFAVTALLAFLRSPIRRLRMALAWLGPAWIYAALLYAAYTLYVFGPWFFERYLFPVSIVLLLSLAALTDSLIGRLRRRGARVATVAFAVFVVISLDLADQDFEKSFTSTDTISMGYMNIGIWAKRTFPAGTIIACAQSGALGYFADSLKVINLDGVVSKSCYESLLHFRCLNYLRERAARYVVGWYSNFQYLEHQSEGMTPRDLSVPKRIEGFQSWGYDWYFAKVQY